jgi:hypothetical protein
VRCDLAYRSGNVGRPGTVSIVVAMVQAQRSVADTAPAYTFRWFFIRRLLSSLSERFHQHVAAMSRNLSFLSEVGDEYGNIHRRILSFAGARDKTGNAFHGYCSGQASAEARKFLVGL